MGNEYERTDRSSEGHRPLPARRAFDRSKQAAHDESYREVPAPVGRPLDAQVRSIMESRFGHDFSRVRVHSDSDADKSASAVGARAFTVGEDIAFASGQYSPATSSGAGLLTHELTHVVQNRNGREGASSAQAPLFSSVSDAAEVEAQGASAAGPGETLSVRQRPSALVHGSWLGGALGALGGAVVGSLIGLVGGPVGAIVGGIVGALVGGVVGAVATRSTAPAAFRTERTPYGTFLVYPDDYSGTLPVPDRTSGEGWPVRESVFARIREVIQGISEGASTITIEGDDAYRTSVLTDLAWLMTVEVGRELLAAIAVTGKNLTIRSTAGGNTTSYDPDADSWENDDGTPGPGANITIGYNTEEWNPYGGDEDWMRRPPAIGLAHELVHAWTGMTGTRARGSTGGVRRRELQATGLGEFATARFTENRFREAFGMPLRPEY